MEWVSLKWFLLKVKYIMTMERLGIIIALIGKALYSIGMKIKKHFKKRVLLKCPRNIRAGLLGEKLNLE
jgi:hypothetical protein